MRQAMTMASVAALLLASGPANGQVKDSSFEVRGRAPRAEGAALAVEIRDGADAAQRPVRVLVTASDGTHPDGAGRGVYADGRFFADGQFEVTVPPGETRVELRSGPNYVPLTFTVDAVDGQTTQVRAVLQRWFAPEERGWYSGDNHVHTQHDTNAPIRTDTDFTALQGRAQGLSYLTQASAPASAEDSLRLTTATFLFCNAQEYGAGAYVGHLNTPGITQPVRSAGRYGAPLSVQALVEAAHAVGGAVTYTHPLAPPHQLHWMGATAAHSDAVLGRCADAFDLDSRGTELLWFSILNLGNRLAASSYTDSCLERTHTLTPGDRRFYTHAAEFTYPAIIAAMRAGRTFATNGGPVFPFFTIDGHEPGNTLTAGDGATHEARVELHSLYPLRSAELYYRGQVVHAFDVAGRAGEVVLTHGLTAAERGWWVLRAEDERNNWAITSPIYCEPADAAARPFAHTMLLEISNATRMVELRREFYAHLILTVSDDDRLTEVELLRDGQVLRRFVPDEGNEQGENTPVTGGEGDYSPGWVWHPALDSAYHFQADWPVEASGWYAVRARTAQGRTLASDAVRFDADNPRSSQISLAHLNGADTRLTRWGYGEDLPLAEVTPPYEGDHWWYEQGLYWRLRADFAGAVREIAGGPLEEGAARFRPAE